MAETSTTHRSTRDGIRLVGGELERVDKRTRALATEHPFLVVGGAMLFGYVCGRLLGKL